MITKGYRKPNFLDFNDHHASIAAQVQEKTKKHRTIIK